MPENSDRAVNPSGFLNSAQLRRHPPRITATLELLLLLELENCSSFIYNQKTYLKRATRYI